MTTRSVPSMFARTAAALSCIVAGFALLSSAPVLAQSQPVPTDQPLQEPLGERVDFSIHFAAGDTFSYRSRMDLRVTQSMPQAELAEQMLVYDLTTRFTVQTVEDDGSATLAMRVTSGRIRVADGDEEFVVVLEADREEDAEFDSPYAAALANTVVTMVVSPIGEITSVLGAEAYLAALQESEISDERLLSFLTAEQIADTFEPLFTIEELNGRPRRVGTGWGTSREIQLPPVAILDLAYNWRLEGMLDGLATMVARVETTVRRPNTPDPARPTVVIEGSGGNVVTQWDSELKAVTRRISTLRMDTQWALGDLQVGQKQQSTLRIERVTAGE